MTAICQAGWRFPMPIFVGVVVLCAVFVDPGWGQEVTIGSPPPSPQGRIIRSIAVERVPIFTDEDREALFWLPLGLVNRLHVNTREAVIRRELLFEVGEPYDPAIVAESERKLRNFGIFAAAEIVTVPAGLDSVDLHVRTRELWSTAVNVAYESFDGDRLWTVELDEKNFLGTARGLTLARIEGVDRTQTAVGLSDRQLFTTTWRGRVFWADSDDGSTLEWRVGKPFFDSRDRWSLRMGFRDQRSAPRYYLTPTEFVRPKADIRRARADYLRRTAIDDDRVWRLGFGVTLDEQDFLSQAPLVVSDAEGELGFTAGFPDDVQEDRLWVTPSAVVERATRDYGVYRYLFAMGTAEDIPFGPEFSARLGWTTRMLGSSEAGMFFAMNGQWFSRFSDGWLQRLELDTSGLADFEKGRDIALKVGISEYYKPWMGVTLAGGVLVGVASGIDRHDVFTLGLESGLRAARYREIAGDRLLRANTEFRYVHTPGLLRLVTPGLAVFADYGTAWFEQGEDFRWELVRGAVGIGLRLGFNRAANDVPIRVDLAWPVLYPTEQAGPILSVGTGHVF